MTLFGLEAKSGLCVRALGRVIANQKGNLSLAESSPAPFSECVLYEDADEPPAPVLRQRRDILDGPAVVVPQYNAGENVGAALPHRLEFRLAPLVTRNDFRHRLLG